jgi:Fur family ferric uptake transcriptional regulator
MAETYLGKTEEQLRGGEEERVFADFLKSRGLKFTRSRRALLRKIFAMHDHFTADQLLERLRKERIPASKATVYRTLAVMQDCGLLGSHDFGGGALHYEHVLGHAHHDHLICLGCRSIVEFRDDRIEDLQERIAKDAGFTLLDHSLKLLGLCRTCSQDPQIRVRHAKPGT